MFPATISPVAPVAPNVNDLWYNTNDDSWNRWDGTRWVPSGGPAGPQGPEGPPGRSVAVTQSYVEPPVDSTVMGDFWIVP
jgi:hypothetical protein